MDRGAWWATVRGAREVDTTELLTRVHLEGSPGGSVGEESAFNAGHKGSFPGSGRAPGEGNGYPAQYSCLENPVDRGAWRATVSPWGRKGLNMT